MNNSNENILNEIINTLGIKIANLEIQGAELLAKNKTLQAQIDAQKNESK